MSMWATAAGRRYPAVLHDRWAAAPIDGAVALGLAGVAVAVGTLGLGGTSLWGDEVFSVDLASTPWPVFWQFVTAHEANMVLYHLLLRGWLGLLGFIGVAPDELMVRAPSILFGAAAVALAYAIGRRWWGRTVGIVAAVVLMLNQLQLIAAREARAYSLEVLLVCAGWYALLAAISSSARARRWWVAFALVMTLALYAHLFSVLILAAQAVAGVLLLVLPTEWRAHARRSFWPAIASFAAIGLAALPLAVYTLRHGPTNPQIGPAGIADVARLAWNVAGHSVVFGVVLAAAVVVATRLITRQIKTGHALPIVLGSWLIVPIVLSYAATQERFNLHLFAWGYLVVVIPVLAILAAIGIAAVRRPALRIAFTLALVTAAALATPEYAAGPSQDFRAASAWIAERSLPDDGLVATSWSSALGVTYYAHLGALSPRLTAGFPAPWSWSAGGAIPLAMPAVERYVGQHPRVFLIDSLLAGDAAPVKAQAADVTAWLDANYRMVEETTIPSSLGPVRVRLYETLQPAYL